MITGTVLSQKSPFSSSQSKLALVIDEFERGGSAGAQVLLPNGSVVSVADSDFSDRFDVLGFSPEFGDYPYLSPDTVEMDFVNGVFDQVFQSERFKKFDRAGDRRKILI